MQLVHFSWGLIWYTLLTCQVNAFEYNITLSHNGPVVLGGTISFKADIFYNDERPSGTFKYKWSDNALIPHIYETDRTSNTTTYWSLNILPENYTVGIYEVEVIVSKYYLMLWYRLTSVRTKFYVTQFLNGDIEIKQSNKTLMDTYVSSASEANVTVNIREGDIDYLMKATTVSIYWFIDCKYFGQTNDLNFLYNFTNSDTSHMLEALVVASYDSPTTTILPPTATSPVTTIVSNITVEEMVTSSIPNNSITIKPTLASITPIPLDDVPNTSISSINISLPYICFNSSIIPPDPNKTYGYFTKKIDVRAPIMNITVEGTNWIQPWDMLSLNVTCKGSGPFNKCLYFHRGKYNITGNETCDSGDHLYSCNFSIIHYFLEPSVYTILIMLNNDVSKQIYPLTINIYKVTTKPQLSVIVVPVSCSLAAVVLIIFGIAYYIQSRARFTVEVADFDFGQNNPEMEYKTFTERLRDSFNNTLRPGNKRISVRQPYYGSMNH
ncbi:hypothetical protein WH47_10291 [Habropoda laboriosa]|uniref:Transmembrane protein 130 n=1 Tax=Habropoda laboriosa TaxID=597456 RepID=A0A0L7R4R8_9HYME|nr:PREDICTED: uncharacterized protein LOC108572022 isoform X2 [Habropoda laboriosa]KOC65829.1 hypothetical protein WH47_10291 [Habropoda laboriosa]